MIDGLGILPQLMLGVAEAAMHVLLASVRPWRYVLSPGYRSRVDDGLAGRSAWVRAWHLAWGSLALAASVAIVGVAASLSPAHRPPAHPLEARALREGRAALCVAVARHARSREAACPR